MFIRISDIRKHKTDTPNCVTVHLHFTGIDVFTSVTVQTGGDVFLNISEADVPKDFHLLIWKFFTDDVLVSFWPSGKPNVRIAYAGRIDILERKYSIKLKNLQKSDVGLYMAMVTAKSEQIISKYNVTVQDPVFPVDLVIDSVSSASSLCNLTVTCTTKDSSISTTVRCTNSTCLQEGGDKSKVTHSGASLHIYLSNVSVICNHSNQVSWSEKNTTTDQLCLQCDGKSIYNKFTNAEPCPSNLTS
uniref:Immunoglobulin V-set domain-containing protein n=1 Tax=Cyprinodon variegatus TaxID=28743 RepID=A0A3Q2D924_CYPVA